MSTGSMRLPAPGLARRHLPAARPGAAGRLGTIALCAAAFGAALAPTPVRADTVVLTDGRQVQGRTREEGDELVVQQKFGEVRFARSLVLRVVKEDDVYSQLERKQKELGEGTADERVLARHLVP